jgi:hypothetical protein
MAANPTIIGKGTYGAVVEPALPNIDEHGNPITFGSNMVSKVMLEQKDYDKLLVDEQLLRERVPALATNITPYRRTFTEHNISAIPNMQNYIDSRDDRDGVYVVRMPNLGLSISDMKRSDAKMLALRAAVTPAAMFKQILKLMYIVKTIRDAGLIHADIRETNVMCNMNGDMTIIDFDWLMTPAQIQAEYPVYFYCHPPESLFLLDKTIPIDNHLLTYGNLALINRCEDLAEDYMADNDADYFWKTVVPQGLLDRTSFATKIAENMGNLRATAVRDGKAAALKRFRKIYYNTVDSFGLAVALLRFTQKFFASHPDTVYRRFLREDVFYKMLDTRSKYRMTIDDAIDVMVAFIRRELPEIQLGEEVSVEDELTRLNALVDFMSEKRRASSERRRKSEDRRTLRQQVEGLALLTKHLERLSTPPKYDLLPPSPPTSSARRTGSSSRGGRRTRVKRPSRGTRKLR